MRKRNPHLWRRKLAQTDSRSFYVSIYQISTYRTDLLARVYKTFSHCQQRLPLLQPFLLAKVRRIVSTSKLLAKILVDSSIFRMNGILILMFRLLWFYPQSYTIVVTNGDIAQKKLYNTATSFWHHLFADLVYFAHTAVKLHTNVFTLLVGVSFIMYQIMMFTAL